MKKIIFIIILLLAIHFIIASKTVAYGESISVLEKEIADLRDDNQKIELEIASSSSLSTIALRITGENNLKETTVADGSGSVVALRR